MTAGTAAAVITAAVAVLGTLLAMARLVYIAGQVNGRIESLMNRLAEDREQVNRDIMRVATGLAQHQQWHFGTGPGRRAGR